MKIMVRSVEAKMGRKVESEARVCVLVWQTEGWADSLSHYDEGQRVFWISAQKGTAQSRN